MDKGILYFCFDNEDFSYSKILNRSSEYAIKNLQLPITVVTEKSTADKFTFDCDKVFVDADKKNVRSYKDKKVKWYNMERNMAYDLSPYNKTILMDVDYFCYTDYIKQISESESDFLVHKDVHDCAGYTVSDKHDIIIPMVWATVCVFTKCNKNKQLFEFIKFIKENYSYYKRMYRIKNQNFRNDYAFAIALHQMHGFVNDGFYIPNAMCQLDQRATLLEVKDNGVVFEKNGERITVEQDIHLLNKEFFNA